MNTAEQQMGEAIVALRAWIQASGSDEESQGRLETFDAIIKGIGSQALVIRALSSELKNRQVGQAALEKLVPRERLAEFAGVFAHSARVSFTLKEIEEAAARLADETSRNTSHAEFAGVLTILKAIAQLVIVFA